jgi:hypothetical protein
MIRPATTTITRPPGHASKQEVACFWDCELDDPEPSANEAALTPQRRVDDGRCRAGELLADPLGTLTVAVAPEGLTGLPERQRRQTDRY